MSKLLSGVLVLLAAFVLAASPALSDVRSDFLASNPNQGWEFGFIDESGTFVAYNTTFDDGQGIAGWCLDNAPGPMGDVTINYSAFAIDRYGVHWEPGQVCIHSPGPGMSAAVRWHAVEDVTVRIEAVLTAQSLNAAADVAISNGGEQLLDGQIGSAATGVQDGEVAAASTSESDAVLSGSVIAGVGSGETVDVIITSGPDQAPSHIGAVLCIVPVGPVETGYGSSSLGIRSFQKQAQLLCDELWLGPLAFDTRIRRS